MKVLLLFLATVAYSHTVGGYQRLEKGAEHGFAEYQKAHDALGARIVELKGQALKVFDIHTSMQIVNGANFKMVYALEEGNEVPNVYEAIVHSPPAFREGSEAEVLSKKRFTYQEFASDQTFLTELKGSVNRRFEHMSKETRVVSIGKIYKFELEEDLVFFTTVKTDDKQFPVMRVFFHEHEDHGIGIEEMHPEKK